ncbi:hypothetical protein F4809DRAFT_592213 [Biscogniauxia mediterranea]|nr:hypothetical protein F4809DRAFT_592213 [Biscogniauxia mediterranea]
MYICHLTLIITPWAHYCSWHLTLSSFAAVSSLPGSLKTTTHYERFYDNCRRVLDGSKGGLVFKYSIVTCH